MRTLVVAFGVLLIVATLLPFIKTVNQWVRFMDYPRLQVAVGLVVVLIAHIIFFGGLRVPHMVFVVAIVAALVVQSVLIYPDTFQSSVQMKTAHDPRAPDRLSVFVANVLMSNRGSSGLLSAIRQRGPDTVMLLETDDRWDGQLSQLQASHEHVRTLPLENTFGLHFFTNVTESNLEVRSLVEPEIPSVVAETKLRNGEDATFYGLHPMPPHLQNSTAGRDAELLIVDRDIGDALAGKQPHGVAIRWLEAVEAQRDGTILQVKDIEPQAAAGCELCPRVRNRAHRVSRQA